MNFLNDNFEINYSSEDNSNPGYLDGYEVRNVSDDITMSLNAAEEIVALQFERMTKDEVELILNDIGKEIDDDLEVLLSDPDSFKEKHGQSYLIYEYDSYGLHILGLDSEMVEAMNRKGAYSLNLFFNPDVFNDFISQ